MNIGKATEQECGQGERAVCVCEAGNGVLKRPLRRQKPSHSARLRNTVRYFCACTLGFYLAGYRPVFSLRSTALVGSAGSHGKAGHSPPTKLPCYQVPRQSALVLSLLTLGFLFLPFPSEINSDLETAGFILNCRAGLFTAHGTFCLTPWLSEETPGIAFCCLDPAAGPSSTNCQCSWGPDKGSGFCRNMPLGSHKLERTAQAVTQ